MNGDFKKKRYEDETIESISLAPNTENAVEVMLQTKSYCNPLIKFIVAVEEARRITEETFNLITVTHPTEK